MKLEAYDTSGNKILKGSLINEDMGNKVFVVFESHEEGSDFIAVCKTQEAATKLIKKLDLNLIKRLGITDKEKIESILAIEHYHYYQAVDLVG
jgi:hypothetical protein